MTAYMEHLHRLEASVAELDKAIEDLVPTMGRADLIRALCALKGVKIDEERSPRRATAA